MLVPMIRLRKRLCPCTVKCIDGVNKMGSIRCTYSYSYKVTLFNKLFSQQSCSVIGLSEKIGFQLESELLATVVW